MESREEHDEFERKQIAAAIFLYEHLNLTNTQIKSILGITKTNWKITQYIPNADQADKTLIRRANQLRPLLSTLRTTTAQDVYDMALDIHKDELCAHLLGISRIDAFSALKLPSSTLTKLADLSLRKNLSNLTFTNVLDLMRLPPNLLLSTFQITIPLIFPSILPGWAIKHL